ncbi:MAG: SsrA-binding protein SmpB [SAR202 cluster bacterium]|nr:SsrA-binding protein SmpB [SAR202 cluster bacterium]
MAENGKATLLNRKARFEYEILETMEAGLVLLGTEVKAIREGRANFSDAYARPEKGEVWLYNANISQYSAGGPYSMHEPLRRRKLLLHKDQILKLTKAVSEKGMTVVPLKLYFNKKHRAKVELGIARGKKLWDKRRTIMDRDREREAQEAMKRRR